VPFAHAPLIGTERVFELIHLTPGGFALVSATVFVGATIQGSVGFGLNLIAVPVVAIVQPAALPAAMIIMAIPMTAGSAALEHGHIDRTGVLWTTLGRLPGVAVGAWVVSVLAPHTLALVTGGFVVLAAAMSAASPPLRIGRRSCTIAGFVGSVMGTASSIGGPPIALLYQNEPGPVLRSTLGATFLIGTAMSLTALVIAGQVAGWHWLLGLALMPSVSLGLYAGRWFHHWLETGWLRPCVLAFAFLTGSVVLLRGLG
jgi:uncharacterized membrane protein YfcA